MEGREEEQVPDQGGGRGENGQAEGTEGKRRGMQRMLALAKASLVAGAWTEREKMFHGGSFLKLADDNMDIQNPEAQNRELSGF